MSINEQKNCIFCKAPKKNGFNVLTAFICLDCEEKIASLSFDDPQYCNYVREIKRFWEVLREEEKVL
ncbi:MAG: sigma factor G inhibitor Gin [Firmicutes bacterium]|nr:sigma factor G inhibitor Gin [Bacillota bacterium]